MTAPLIIARKPSESIDLLSPSRTAGRIKPFANEKSAPIEGTWHQVQQRSEKAPASSVRFLGRKTRGEQLFDARAAAKIAAAKVSMHISRDRRDRFFAQLDRLLDEDAWEDDDVVPSVEPFTTYLRMLIYLGPCRDPGLGATSNGNVIAMWSADSDRLTIECFENDRVRYLVSKSTNENIETTVGNTVVSRLKDVLVPFDYIRWFFHGQTANP